MNERTPPPWTVGEVSAEGNRKVFGPDIKAQHVCTVWHKGRPGYARSRPDVAEANARLIASAPDLLAIVQEIVADSHDLGRVTADTMDSAETILAKAAGR